LFDPGTQIISSSQADLTELRRPDPPYPSNIEKLYFTLFDKYNPFISKTKFKNQILELQTWE
jgi:hypothetical protein